MTNQKKLNLVDVIQRSLRVSVEDVSPLTKYLGQPIDLKPTRDTAVAIADYLRKMGSNDIATLFRSARGGVGGDG